MPATGVLERHARVHHRQGSAADARHRRGPVRLEDVRHDAHRVRKLLFGRNHRRQRALGQRSVADLAAPGAGHAPDFTDREGREVVVEHEALPRLALERLDLLRIVGRAERAGDERLRFAAREDRGPVRAGEDAGLDPDRADLVELPAVEPDVVREHFLAQDLFLQLLEDGLRVGFLLRFAFGQRRHQVLQRELHGLVVFELAANPHGVGQRAEHLAFDFAVEGRRDFLPGDRDLLAAGGFRHVVDGGDDLLDRGVRDVQRLDDLRFRHFLRARFDHHEAVFAARDDEIELALLALLERRVHHVLPVHQAHPHAGNRLFEGDAGQRERRGCARDGQDVRVVLGIGRQHQRDDLRFVAPARREQGPDRPVDDAAGQDFLLGRLAFALEEAAGNAAGRVGVFAVVHRQRQEVDAFARACGTAGRDQHHRIAVPDDHGAVGLFGQLARFEGQRLIGYRDFASSHKGSISSTRSKRSKRSKGSKRSERSERSLRPGYFLMLRRLIRSA